MTLPSIPEKINDWDLRLLDELLQIRDIERETFDFKTVVLGNNPVPSDLHNDICAMANTDGGYLFLGIGEIKDKSKVVGFKKIGFEKGKEDIVGRTVNEHRLRVEPIPKIDILHLPDGDRFYTILKIILEDFEKPFFIRERAQCYVRIGSSTRPASRNTIIRLFANMNRRLDDIENLRITTVLLRESFMHTVKRIGDAHPDIRTKITPIDLTLIRSAILQSEWFLAKKKLLGGMERNGYTVGITTFLHVFEQLNIYINSYNSGPDKRDREYFFDYLRNWKEGYSEYERWMEFLNKLEKEAREFLEDRKL